MRPEGNDEPWTAGTYGVVWPATGSLEAVSWVDSDMVDFENSAYDNGVDWVNSSYFLRNS